MTPTNTILAEYRKHAIERESQHLPPLPLDAAQTRELIGCISQGHPESALLLHLLASRVEPGVSAAAKIKATWLEQVALGHIQVKRFSPDAAIRMLSRMGGGDNVQALLRLLQVPALAKQAVHALKGLTKVYEAFDKVCALAEQDNGPARDLLVSWATAEWFTKAPPLPREIRCTVCKVDGEINTDDFSPGNQAQSRADIPLHATFFGIKRFPGGIEQIRAWREQGRQVAFAGDVVGTGSSRKSAINSISWHLGEDVPFVPNRRRGGLVLGQSIAPIFYATARDAGVLALICDTSALQNGDELILNLADWHLHTSSGQNISLTKPPPTLLDEYRAGGRLNLIIGCDLTQKACDWLGLPFPALFQQVENPRPEENQQYTLAQKMVGRACGLLGVLAGTNCQPAIHTVGSQDTTGPMTMQEINDLACRQFKTDLFMQSFCHTAAYPKQGDAQRWQDMRETTLTCGGVALKPGDGVIHTWLNRMLVPDTVGTGGDSHTRFPLGISFPAGSGLVAFAAALGFMPLEMPESVLVRFHGARRPGITVRDMVNAIPWQARTQGFLTVDKKGKKNIFAGAILEIEGIDDLSVEEAFELSNASAERSASACALQLSQKAVIANVQQNIAILKQLIGQGYDRRNTLESRIEAMQEWLRKPDLLRADSGAQYKAILDIDLDSIPEPLLACPNDPDDVRLLSEVAGTRIDEAFIGSCMIHPDHLHQVVRLCEGEDYAVSRLWIAPSSRLDREQLIEEGSFSTLAQVGARIEIAGCSLCMGNQARVRPGSTVISTSTRNFDNRLGDDTRVYLASAELTTIAALLGRIPDPDEYMAFLARKIV